MSSGFFHVTCLLYCIVLTSFTKCDNTTSKIPLYIGGFFGVNIQEGAWSTAEVIPSLEMALEHVNNDPSILVDYQLKYVWNDSKCESGSGIKAMLTMIDTPPHKIVFLGPGCSVATVPVAEAAPYWQAVQIGYSTSSPQFSDKEKFPLYFRTSTSETMENPTRVALLEQFNWKKVAILVQNLDIFVWTKEDLIPLLNKSNISIIATESFKYDPSSSVKYLIKDKDARIIIGLMYEDMFRKAMCAAYKDGLFGKKYVWIIVGWYLEDWWTKTTEVGMDCRGEQLLEAAANLIETFPLQLSRSTRPTISNRTAQQLQAEYDERRRRLNYTYHMYAGFTYDAAWSIAVMLNKSIPRLRARNKTLETVKYGDKEVAEIMTDILFRTDFWGMSGRVKFDKDGNRDTLVEIFQNKRGKKKIVATVDSLGRNLSQYKDKFEWEEGKVPLDGVRINEKQFKESFSLTLMFFLLAFIGVLLCFFSLLFNVTYRKHQFIKMSSPKFNDITVIGCLLSYIEMFLSAYANSDYTEHDISLCYIRIWLLSTGFTLAFGGIFVKTWRVYKIFTNTQMRKELGNLSSTSLLLRLCVALFVDFIFLSTWTAIDPMTMETEKIDNKVPNDDSDFKEQLVIHQCTSSHYMTWLISMSGLKGIMLIFGVFLAWETRNVHYPSLNDSKNIGLAVYNVFMFSCLAIVAEFVVFPPLKTQVQRSIVFVATTSTIALLFVPKVLYLRKNTAVSTAAVLETNNVALENHGVTNASNSVEKAKYVKTCAN
ncbi:gamma-aminobutyric acid type B receptor subunit 2-like [Pocillopora damicornis]|uniref:gamma-aminobutyric acid type B receptor subunit 2-like n=1 Tax=Pocillopora damicornis TaxID=46731 RepID=UPI000F558168|nr:gamma-aminobutyric acid type B receptor subunit 2-like [Pocillopora damicornis]XP_027040339.1 gamma-aminobutyric acid type B receptor subunit 2-like [Pocillopora damicornis]XP_027040340.1 gamma-aminobutyric acid type B receptor subunit 2-like [Pocillopora damicornis]